MPTPSSPGKGHCFFSSIKPSTTEGWQQNRLTPSYTEHAPRVNIPAGHTLLEFIWSVVTLGHNQKSTGVGSERRENKLTLGSVVSAGLMRHPRRDELSLQVPPAMEHYAGFNLAGVAGDDSTQRLVAEVAGGDWQQGLLESKTVT